MKRKLHWFIANSLQVGLLYFWLVNDQTWAENLFKFWTGIILLSCLGMLSKEHRKKMRKVGRSMPRWATNFIDGAMIIALIATGHFWMGFIFLFFMVMENNAFEGND